MEPEKIVRDRILRIESTIKVLQKLEKHWEAKFLWSKLLRAKNDLYKVRFKNIKAGGREKTNGIPPATTNKV
jgi:hypothetical protein